MSVTQHPDPRAHQTPPQFPPPHAAAAAQQVPHHLAPEHTPPPTQPYHPTDLRRPVAERPMRPEYDPSFDNATPDDGAANSDFEEPQYGNYFGFGVTHKYVMPDKRQWIEFKVLDEGGIAQYHSILDRDVTVEKMTGNARIKINQVQERHALLRVAVIDWHMVQPDGRGRWVPVKFNNSPGGTFVQWMLHANPEIVADLYEAIQKVNPSLLPANQDTVEAIDKQMEDLARQRAVIVERMAGKPDSANS